MYKLSITFGLLFNFMAIIYAPTGSEASNVLPLVFFSRPDSQDLQPPDKFKKDKIVIHNGRLSQGTMFTVRITAKQMFFCPKKDSDEKCLVPQEFQKLAPLRCATEPIPVVPINENLDSCGSNGAGTPHDFVYEFCPGYEPYDNGTKDVSIYIFCYDGNNDRTLFTRHYIMSPELLESTTLTWERNVAYPMDTTDEFIPSDYENFKAALEKENESQDMESSYQIQKGSYKVQKLVPSEDMAFALWRKPTFQFSNVDWQHEKLIPLWNEINQYIRHNAAKIFASDMKLRSYVETGVFQLSSKKRNDGQMSNVWIKIIYTMSEKPGKYSMSGVAILMNNFIDGSTQTTTEMGGEIRIDDYCKEDSTTDSLKTKFDNVGGKILCCPLTKEIRGIFGGKETFPLQMLHIPGITKPAPEHE